VPERVVEPESQISANPLFLPRFPFGDQQVVKCKQMLTLDRYSSTLEAVMLAGVADITGATTTVANTKPL
jgi:hypothetical protein